MTGTSLSSSLLTAATRPSLRGDAIATLHAAIIAGELRPGAVYSAPSLAQQLGMSATPVREAMLDLVKEGLVEAVPNKGFRVVEVSEAELDELTELRELIEVPSVGRLAERGLAAGERAQLRELAAAIEQAAADRDLIAHNRADLAFHTNLLGLLGNRQLVGVIHSLRIRSRLYGQARLADAGQLAPTSDEHGELLDLIEAGNADGARDLMRRHIGHVRGEWATGSTVPTVLTGSSGDDAENGPV